MYKFIHITTLVTLILCINWSLCQSDSAPVTCGSLTCGQNESCCGSTCFDASLSSCVTSSTGQQVLCGFEHLPLLIPDKACGTTCYDTLAYTCCGDQLFMLNDTLPEGCAAAASSSTGGPLSSSSSTTGIASTTTGSVASCGSGSCIAGEECCASTCFNTSLFSCIIANNGQQILCGFEHLPDLTPDKVCGTTCYDALAYICCNNQLVSLSEASSCPSGTTRSSSTTGGSSSSTTGPASSTTGSAVACGNGFCGIDDQCCDSVCFNTSLFSCIIASNGQQILCGFEHLPSLVPDKVCGTTCYDAENYNCCNDQLYSLDETLPASCGGTPSVFGCGNGVCNAGEGCCQNECYNFSSFVCVTSSNFAQQVLCDFGETPGMYSACNTTCYDITQSICCNDVLYSISQFANCGAVTNFANGVTPSNPEVLCQYGNQQRTNDAELASTVSSVLMAFALISMLA